MQNNIPFNLPIPTNSITYPPLDPIYTPLILNNQSRLDELNLRLSNRFFPDYIIPQSITPRPIETRQTILGKSIDPRNSYPLTDIIKYPEINSSISKNFISGDKGEPNWFLANIDTETILKNQCFALQKGDGSPQANYIPSNNSELYKPTLPHNSNIVIQPYPYLFKNMQFNENKRKPINIYNDPRNQYIINTFTSELSSNTNNNIQYRKKIFYNIDRPNLSTSLYQ